MSPGPEQSGRRSFLKTATVLIGGVIGAVLAVPIVRYLTFPVRRKVVIGADTPVPVIDEARVVAGAPPLRVQIITPEQRDAWGKQQNVPLGAAWVSRGADGQVRALSATCPHLGCAVDYDPGAGQFKCPCHTSAFSSEGEQISGPAKRGMDPLETSVVDGRVMVRFEKFKLDTSKREKA
jgi:menaquinol-cytochrome c reductase iron-sulfur subunit